MRGQTLAFLGVSVALILSPGPDFALVTRNAVRGGRRAGIVTSLGTSTGLAVHALAAVLGVSALLAASPAAFTVLKIAGGAYLAVLGLRSLWALRHPAGQPAGAHAARGRLTPFRQGVLTNVLNPKVAVFFLTFLPQFTTPGEAAALTTLRLALVFVAMALAWLLVYVSLLHRLRGWLERPRVRRVLDAVTGSALLLLGVRLALDRP